MAKQEIKEAIHKASITTRRSALAFRPDGGGSYTAACPGGHGYSYVRLLGVGGVSLTIARDLVGLSSPGDDNTPIWVEFDADGTLAITARRYSGS
jgi:hypothetical protein